MRESTAGRARSSRFAIA